ncbi:MAG: YitT family protein [Clostridia bacterium]|nr:YitT family protein [Clostridia bacterium]
MKKTVLRHVKNYTLIFLGGASFALAFNIFLRPAHVVPGGLTGVAALMNYLWDLPAGGLVLLMNVPLYIAAAKKMGVYFTLRTFAATLVMSFFIDFLDFLPAVTDERALCAVYGGAAAGTGMSLIFYGGATSGGSDLAARLINRRSGISMGRLIFIIDSIVVLLSIPVYGDINAALFAAIEIFIETKVIDALLTGFDMSKAAYIITKKPTQMSLNIINELHRSATAINAVGMYSGEEYSVLMVVVKTRETPRLKEIIKNADPSSFAVIISAGEVFGEGFKRYGS